MTQRSGSLLSAFGLLWRGLDRARRLFVNLLFLILVVLVLSLLLADRRPKVPKGAALVISPSGLLAEQLHGKPGERALLDLLGRKRPETLMRSVLEAVEAARDDDRIQALYLDLGQMAGGGLSKLQALRRSIEAFRESGKTVVASADFYTQSRYYLASTADEIYLHQMGVVLLTGYGVYRNYFKEALDRLEVDWNVFRVGEYKSAVEPYIRNDMSPQVREARRELLSQLWEAYKVDVAGARELSPQAIEDYAARFHLELAKHGGHAARLARATGLVDEVVSRDQVRERMIELVGEDGDSKSFRQIDYQTYLEAVRKPPKASENVIGVVVAKGTILDGSQPPGTVGGESTAGLIRRAREDDEVKALVLRVDSAGGSTFASELIRREVELTREKGIPVVASMSSVAASGGYWISMSADEIWANPTTITGSIGIYAMLPTIQKTLTRFGIHNDGVGTTPLAGTLRPDRDLPPEAAEAIRLMVDQGYREFVTRAAEGRNKTPEEIDRIARGRVWIGRQAQSLGLVDHLGDLQDAVAAVATRADLGEDYRLVYIEERAGMLDRLLGRLLAPAGEWLGPLVRAALPQPPDLRWLEGLLGDEPSGARLEDPRGLLAYCFCDPN